MVQRWSWLLTPWSTVAWMTSVSAGVLSQTAFISVKHFTDFLNTNFDINPITTLTSSTLSCASLVLCRLSCQTPLCAWLASRCSSVWSSKSHRTSSLLFSNTVSCVSQQEWGTYNPYAAEMFLHTVPAGNRVSKIQHLKYGK